MLELLVVLPALHLVEVVHVQLAHERGVVARLEVVRQDLDEPLNIRYYEGVAVIASPHYRLRALVLLSLPPPCCMSARGSA